MTQWSAVEDRISTTLGIPVRLTFNFDFLKRPTFKSLVPFQPFQMFPKSTVLLISFFQRASEQGEVIKTLVKSTESKILPWSATRTIPLFLSLMHSSMNCGI